MFTGTVPNITQILITSNLLTVKFAEVFCWTISDVTLLKSTIMISIPRFQNEKKITDKRTILKITINFGTQIDLLCFKNRT